MNGYKKIIRNQDTRLKILKSLRFIPDAWILRLMYRIKTGNKLHLKKPERYTEKIQWYKINYRDPLMTACADKYKVREYIKSKGLGHILNECYAVYKDPDSIDFNQLPDSFALKCSVGSGLNIFVQNKNQVNLDNIREEVRTWFSVDSYSYGREWCYKDSEPVIIAEKLLPRNSKNDIPDYKFFCFNGEVFCLYTMIDYTDNHDKGKLGFFDRNFKQMPYFRKDFAPITDSIDKPVCFDEMLKYAGILSKDFPHVRVDFYDVDGSVVFGELTYYNASGFTVFSPDEFDYIMGKHFVLPKIKKSNEK